MAALAITSLLNPDPSGPESSMTASRFRPNSILTSTQPFTEKQSPVHQANLFTSAKGQLHSPQRLELSSMRVAGAATRESESLPKSKPKGDINYPPFENIDEESKRKVVHFQVHPFGNITSSFSHIPYNSGKKDFSQKTGRERLEGKT